MTNAPLVIVHHGGSFVTHPTLQYVGGKVSIFSDVPRRTGLSYLQSKIRSLGYNNIDKIQFLNGEQTAKQGDYLPLFLTTSGLNNLQCFF